MKTTTVGKIEVLLAEVAGLQNPYVQKMCPMCGAPCCGRVQYVFDEKDVIFLKLSRRKWNFKRAPFKQKGCPFLGPEGCTLDPLARPFICHNYICPDLEREIEFHEPGLVLSLRERLREIALLRTQMWCEYLEIKTPESAKGP